MNSHKKGLSKERGLEIEQAVLLLGRQTNSEEYKKGLTDLVRALYAETKDVGLVALLGNLARDPAEKSSQKQRAELLLLLFPEKAISSKYWLGSHFLIGHIASLDVPEIAQLMTELQDIVDEI